MLYINVWFFCHVDAEWLRFEHRVFGRPSFGLESSRKKDNYLLKRFSLPVRLDFEEVVLLLTKSIIKGLTLSNRIQSISKPSSETIKQYGEALARNTAEMV